MGIGLDLVGLALTVIEIYLPRASARLETWIDALPERLVRWSDRLSPGLAAVAVVPVRLMFANVEGGPPAPDTSRVPDLRSLAVGILSGIGLFAAFLIAVAVLILALLLIAYGDESARIGAMVFAAIFALLTLLPFAVLIAALALLAATRLIRALVHLLNRVTGGHAIGTVGLALAATGIATDLLGRP
ncbi:hypothetical protein [Pontivivens ytuae]|uniref:Uncharacterized protein n=1 Tax=Pontivivens ytuae TaxID=2789856 RepID=A0A7S9LSJ6_9RHOB|nr:hypothetical protein [Pontivivens ytuae]QPH54447.1 hypothetical protein I0K15_01295 [Pontivivens ytuae]